MDSGLIMGLAVGTALTFIVAGYIKFAKKDSTPTQPTQPTQPTAPAPTPTKEVSGGSSPKVTSKAPRVPKK